MPRRRRSSVQDTSRYWRASARRPYSLDLEHGIVIGWLGDGPEPAEPDCPPLSLSNASAPAHRACIKDAGRPQDAPSKARRRKRSAGESRAGQSETCRHASGRLSTQQQMSRCPTYSSPSGIDCAIRGSSLGPAASTNARTTVLRSSPNVANCQILWGGLPVMRSVVSNCLENQVRTSRRSDCQGIPLRAIAFRMVSSFRMQAVSATLAGLPAARSRW